MGDYPTTRRLFFKEAFLRPATAIVAVPYTIWGILAFVRDEIVQPRNASLWKPVFWLSKLPWSAWLIATLAITVTVLFEGAFRLLRLRELELLAFSAHDDVIDVRLEGTFPGSFSLRATGHACEIRTGPIVQESGIVSVHNEADRTIPVVTPRYVLEFPVMSDLRDDRKEISPTLFCEDVRLPHLRSGWPKPGADVALAEFFRNAVAVRRSPDRPELSVFTDERVIEMLNNQRQPFEFAFSITFWNSDHTHQWARQELLIYDPQRNMAFVRHAGVASRVPDSSEKRTSTLASGAA